MVGTHKHALKRPTTRNQYRNQGQNLLIRNRSTLCFRKRIRGVSSKSTWFQTRLAALSDRQYPSVVQTETAVPSSFPFKPAPSFTTTAQSVRTEVRSVGNTPSSTTTAQSERTGTMSVFPLKSLPYEYCTNTVAAHRTQPLGRRFSRFPKAHY